jgi:hypothetical protein
MEIPVKVILCVLLGLLLKQSVLAADLTLHMREQHKFPINTWPRIIYDNSSLCKGELKFEFKTFLKDALVLYQDDYGVGDFLAITLQDGHFRVITAFGEKIKKHKTSKKYNDFKWHSVVVRLNCPEPCIEVKLDDGDDDKEMYKEQRANECEIDKNLQIGGFSSRHINAGVNSVSYYELSSEYMRPDVR